MTVGDMIEFLKDKEKCRTMYYILNGIDFKKEIEIKDIAFGDEHLKIEKPVQLDLFQKKRGVYE